MSVKSTRITKITTHTNTYGPLKLVSLDAQIETKKLVDKYPVYIKNLQKLWDI